MGVLDKAIRREIELHEKIYSDFGQDKVYCRRIKMIIKHRLLTHVVLI